jgi:hypothetical protein
MKKSTVNAKLNESPSIKHSFTGKNLTAHGGLSPMNKFLSKIGLKEEFNRLFPTQQYNSLKFLNAQIMMAVIFGSLCGINRLSRITNMTFDPLVMRLLGIKKAFNKDLISTRLKELGERGARKLHGFFQLFAHDEIRKSGLKSITLDVDSTVFGVCGNQEGVAKGYNPSKKGAKSYHPLIGFVSELKLVINTWFRTGSAYTANGICEFVREIAAHIPETVRTVFFRADSGFFNGDLFTLCENLGWDYLVKVSLKGFEKILQKQTWIPDRDGNEYCIFTHKCGNWDKERTFYGVRTIIGSKAEEMLGIISDVPVYMYSAFCSNRESSAQEIYASYRERSTSETWIEEVKGQALAGKTLTDSFHANEMLWLLNAMAYNVGVLARKKTKSARTFEHKTFRDQFMNVPAILKQMVSGFDLQLYRSYYFARQWSEIDRAIS